MIRCFVAAKTQWATWTLYARFRRRRSYENIVTVAAKPCVIYLELARSKPSGWFLEKMFRPVYGEIAKKKTKLAEAGLTKREKYCQEQIKLMLAEAIAESQSK